MKNNLLGPGMILLFVAGIVLATLFLGDQIPKEKKSIENFQVGSSIQKEKKNSLSVVSRHTEKEMVHYTYQSHKTEDNTSKIQRGQDQSSKRMLVIERREERMAEKKRYQTARHEWRRSLNKAHKEAKISGDYSKYETIKSNAPGKN